VSRQPGYGSLVRRYRLPLVLLACVFAYGVLGYWIVAGWSFSDALYMTVISLSTVGFQEVQPLTDGERLFTISLLPLRRRSGLHRDRPRHRACRLRRSRP
jgi:voltage-gated potassium channel